MRKRPSPQDLPEAALGHLNRQFQPLAVLKPTLAIQVWTAPVIALGTNRVDCTLIVLFDLDVSPNHVESLAWLPEDFCVPERRFVDRLEF